MLRSLIKLVVSLILIAFHWVLVHPAAAETFPSYEVIQPNVSFWVKIYAAYPTTRAVVHDNTHLGIVYEVIALKPHDTKGARKLNRQRMKRVRGKYQDVLKRLVANPGTKDAEARRVAALFGPDAGAKDFKRAAGRVRCQIGQMDRFRAGLTRSGAYIEEIRSILISYGVPEDLAYLPHVESSFNPQAYSKFGAAGIWQFTRSTGKRFMTVGYEIDERRDPIRATHAAARLLKENHERLGSWPLAITAYNHGAAGVARAKSKQGDYPDIFRSYRSRSFKFASRNFYSEFLAARQVAANHDQYFDALPMAQPTPTRTVELTGYANFADLCRHFDIAPETLKTLNPALRPPVINGQKYVPRGYHLRLNALPADNNAALAAIPETLYRSAQKRSRFYTVQRGDTAGKIARSHGVRLSDLIAANNLNRRATIYPRQTLRLPLPGEKVTVKPPPSPPTLVAARNTAPSPRPATVDNDTAPPLSTERPVVPAPAPPMTDDLPRPIMASVVPLAGPETKPEKAVKPSAPSTEIVAADVRFERIAEIENRPVGILAVEVEETLGHYAEWAGVRTHMIRRLNGLPYGRTLHLHQKVKIPLNRTTQAAFEEQRYEFHKRLQEDFFAVYRVSELEAYRVRRGDSYWTLCRDKFEIPLWLLKHYNGDVDLADLRMRQKLLIPMIEKTDAGDSGTVAPEELAEMPAEG